MTQTIAPKIISAKAPFYLLQKLQEGIGGYDVAMCADAQVLIRYAKANWPEEYREFEDAHTHNGHGYHQKGEYVALKADHPDRHEPKPPGLDQCPSLLIKPVPYVYPLLPPDEARARWDRIESRFETQDGQ